MFDLISGRIERPFRESAPALAVLSAVLHAVGVALLIGIPLLQATSTLPELPAMMVFVAPLPAPTPVPLPPAPAAPPGAAPRSIVRPVPHTATVQALPAEAPHAIVPEAEIMPPTTTDTNGVAGGVPGGVEGGVLGGLEGGSGGLSGGVAANAVAALSPPPPPPPPKAPVRVGGQIGAPTILHRVDPIYPDLAAAAHITGVVILEGVVGADGYVQSVTVLRGRHALLDLAATNALRQWRYTPLVLNGTAVPFVLTVTFTFSTP